MRERSVSGHWESDLRSSLTWDFPKLKRVFTLTRTRRLWRRSLKKCTWLKSVSFTERKEERERERDRERELHGQVHKKVTHALKEGLARARTHLGSFYISRESFAIFGKWILVLDIERILGRQMWADLKLFQWLKIHCIVLI